MSRLVASFDGVDTLKHAVAAARQAGFAPVDAFSPFPLDDVGPGPEGLASIGWAAALGAVLGGGGTFALETFSAAIAYRFDSGGRPAFSWPVFVLSAFEIGVLCAGVFAFAAFLWRTGLPRLNHPVFDSPGIERASQDRFLLLFERPASVKEHAALAAALKQAISLDEVGG